MVIRRELIRGKQEEISMSEGFDIRKLVGYGEIKSLDKYMISLGSLETDQNRFKKQKP
jgi:hypothetical protein